MAAGQHGPEGRVTLQQRAFVVTLFQIFFSPPFFPSCIQPLSVYSGHRAQTPSKNMNQPICAKGTFRSSLCKKRVFAHFVALCLESAETPPSAEIRVFGVWAPVARIEMHNFTSNCFLALQAEGRHRGKPSENPVNLHRTLKENPAEASWEAASEKEISSESFWEACAGVSVLLFLYGPNGIWQSVRATLSYALIPRKLSLRRWLPGTSGMGSWRGDFQLLLATSPFSATSFGAKQEGDITPLSFAHIFPEIALGWTWAHRPSVVIRSWHCGGVWEISCDCFAI